MKKIGEILSEKTGLRGEAIASILALSRKEAIRFGEAAIKLGLIDELQLASSLASQFELEELDIKSFETSKELKEIIPAEIFRKNSHALLKNDDAIVLAVSDPTDLIGIDIIESLAAEKGILVEKIGVVPSTYIKKILQHGPDSLGPGSRANSFFIDYKGDASEEQAIEKDGGPVVELLNNIIDEAIQKRASDIHIESYRDGLFFKFRIDGALHTVLGPVYKKMQSSIISRLKIMSELDISESRIPQDGRFKTKIQDKYIDFRVSIMPSIHGEDAVIRVLDKEHISKEFECLRLESLGFDDSRIKHIRKMIHEPYGMVLVTGPTGSGKTTTLYAALSEINTGEDKIITIEDPVEYELKGVIQIQVNEKKGLSFAKGLRSILRHDPDKIMIGEIRDTETAQIAIQAALTGHLVFTTVHANNVFDVIGRFIHMGIEPFNFVSALNCVLAQRLLRMVCDNCKEKIAVSPQILEEAGIDEKYAAIDFYEGKGCEECNLTGYKGRKAIAELLDLTDEIRDLISSKQPMSVIKKKAIDSGMVTLRQSAFKFLASGETTIKEVNRVTFSE